MFVNYFLNTHLRYKPFQYSPHGVQQPIKSEFKESYREISDLPVGLSTLVRCHAYEVVTFNYIIVKYEQSCVFSYVDIYIKFGQKINTVYGFGRYV